MLLLLPCCRWSNLVQPADAAIKVTTNSSLYTPQQLQQRRHLLGSTSSSSSKELESWFNNNSRVYVASTDTRSGTDGTLAFSADGTVSNGSIVDGLTNALIMTGTSRWPSAYTARELQMAIIALFAVVTAATVLQGLVLLLWRVFKLNAEDLPK